MDVFFSFIIKGVSENIFIFNTIIIITRFLLLYNYNSYNHVITMMFQIYNYNNYRLHSYYKLYSGYNVIVVITTQL